MTKFTGRVGVNGIVLSVHVQRLQREQQSRTTLDSSRFLRFDHNSLGVCAFGDDRFAFDHHRVRDGGPEVVPRSRLGGHGLIQNHVDSRVFRDRDRVAAPLGNRAPCQRRCQQNCASRDEVVPLAQVRPV